MESRIQLQFYPTPLEWGLDRLEAVHSQRIQQGENMRLSLFLLLSLLTLSTTAAAAEEPVLKRYNMESGIIRYVVGGDHTGEVTVYFDQWGMREAKYNSTTLIMGKDELTSNTVSIMKDFWIYSLDVDQKVAIQLENQLMKQIADKVISDGSGNVGEELLRVMEAESMGTKEYAGKTCDVWKISQPETEICVWNWIPISSRANLTNTSLHIDAISIQENVEIPEEKFNVPEDYRVLTREDLQVLTESAAAGLASE